MLAAPESAEPGDPAHNTIGAVRGGRQDDMSEPRSLPWLRKLVAVDTTSRNPNGKLIAMIADELRTHGLEPVVFDNPDGTKQGLVATIPAADGTTTGGVVLSGHTDVVPVDGQQWTSDPWTVTERDGKLHGRGVADMKGYLATILALLPELTAAQLSQPIHLAFSYDEEVGCRGGDAIVAKLHELGREPRAALVGEPTSMRVIRAHKSVNLYTVTFTGVAAHSSLTANGVNAVEYAAQLACWWRDLTDAWKAEGPFDEAYPLKWSTGGVNQFTGGTAVNIVPAKAELVLEFRSIAEVDDDDVLARTRAEVDRLRALMQAENPAADVQLVVDAAVPSLDVPADAWAAQLAEATGGTRCDDKVTYGTEAGQFARGGIPAVVCGPGDIAQAHTPDEWIEPSQLDACAHHLLALVAELS